MSKSKGKKVNPRRIPASGADINRAKKDATTTAMRRVLYLVLYVLIDKHNASHGDVKQFAQEINHAAQCVQQGYATWKDIERVVTDEYDIEIPW